MLTRTLAAGALASGAFGIVGAFLALFAVAQMWLARFLGRRRDAISGR